MLTKEEINEIMKLVEQALEAEGKTLTTGMLFTGEVDENGNEQIEMLVDNRKQEDLN